MNVNDVAKKIAPFLKESGFTKKGNRFFKLKGLCLFVVSFEAGSLIRPGFFVYPLYYPFSFKSLEFGSHLHRYQAFPIKNLNRECSESELDEWISKLKRVLSNSVFKHLEHIDSLSKLSEFLDNGYGFVHFYWEITRPDNYFVLKAYTDFMCGKKAEMQKSIEKGIYYINEFPTSEHIKQDWRNSIEILCDMFDRTDVEKRVFVEGIVKNTLLECLGKKWETLINGPLSLSLDFTNS